MINRLSIGVLYRVWMSINTWRKVGVLTGIVVAGTL